MTTPAPSLSAARGHDGRPSLRHRLMAGLGIIVLAGVLFLVFGVTFFVYRTERESWQGRQREAASAAGRTVDTFMRQVQDYMTWIGLLDREYLESRPQVLHDLLDQAPALLEIIRLDAAGNAFAGAYQDSPVMINLFTIPQSSWFLQARAGRPYVGQVQLSAKGEPYLIMAIPAPDEGVVAARLRMNLLWDVVSELRFGETGLAYVVNRRGEIVAHPDPEIVLARSTIADRLEMEAALQAPGNQWSDTYINFAGTAVVGSTVAVPDSDWIIFTEISRAEAFATSRRALLVLGGAVLLVGVLINFLVGWQLRDVILRPMDALRDGAVRIGQGDLDHRIEIVRADEIGQVAEEFNEMAAKLHDRETALEQARDEALEASRFKSRLLANVSHDLRTPLNVISGYAEMLHEGVLGDLNDDQLLTAERILGNAGRLLNLINSLLDQAQIEAGTLKLRYGEFDPAELLGEVEAMMGLLAETKGLQLATTMAPGLPPTLVGDRQRIQQVVINLVDNGIKFTREGGVRARLYLPDPAHWAVEVADSGPGIPPEVQNFIFEPFRQADDSTTREHRGVGLGLSIVKQLVTLMGGETSLSSEMGHGSTFTVSLPLNPPKEEGR